MTSVSFHYAVAFAAVVLAAFAQLLLKIGARTPDSHRLAIWLNVKTLAGYATMLIVTLMNLYAYRVVPLHANVFLLPIVFVLVALLSMTALGERMTTRQIVGCGVLLIGVVVFNL